MTYDFQTPGPIDGNVKIAAGLLEITADERGTTSVLIEPLDSSNASIEAARDTKVEMRGNQLYVGAPDSLARHLFSRARLRVVIQLPHDSTIQVNVASADATIRGRYRDVVVNNASGHIWLEDVTGDVSVKTASGRVQLGTVGGHCRVDAASGVVQVGQVAQTVVVHSASGDVAIGDAASHVSVTTASGNVNLGVIRTGTAKINTASGSVRIGVAAGTGTWCNLNTASGRTTSDLAINGNAPADQQAAATLSVRVRTASGDIALCRAVPA